MSPTQLHAHFAQCGSRDLSADHPIPSSPIQSNPVPYSSIQNERLFTVGVFLDKLSPISHRPGICSPPSPHEPFPEETAFELCLASPLRPYLGIEPWKEEPDGTAPAHCGAGQDALRSVELVMLINVRVTLTNLASHPTLALSPVQQPFEAAALKITRVWHLARGHHECRGRSG
jgi:hypothetical protein